MSSLKALATNDRFWTQFRCRLCWRVTAVVFAGIFAIEAAILIPSYRNYEGDLLDRLNETGHAAMVASIVTHGQPSDRDLLIIAGALTAATKLRGGVLYRPGGKRIGVFGEAPTHAADTLLQSGPQRVSPERFEVIWPADESGLPVTVVARLDSSTIPGALRAFLWRIAGLVLLISFFVCGTIMVILSRFVLLPLLDIRSSLLKAQEDAANADQWVLPETRSDEVGEVMVALNRLLRRVSKVHSEELAMMVTMVENSNEGFVVYDGQGEVVYANRACLAFCAVDHMRDLQAQGLPRFERTDRSGTETVIEIAASGLFAGEAVLRDRDDKTLPCFIDVSRGEDEAGDVIRYYASITDITDLSQTRQHLAQKNLELMAADQAKSRFLANMSHELRTPLNAIMGFSEVIKNEMFGPVGLPQYVEYAVDIHNSGAHLLAIINDILDLSKVEAGKFELSEEEVDLREVIAAVGNLVKGRSEEKDITLETIIPDPAPRLYADKRTLKQMLLNLLSNAIKFTPKGGHVTITGSIGGNNEILLAVSDNGIGIDRNDIATVMSPFGQVDSSLAREHEGTGLGLPLVRAMIELHGGTLTLDSEVDHGTTVTIRFPPSRLVRDAPEAITADMMAS